MGRVSDAPTLAIPLATTPARQPKAAREQGNVQGYEGGLLAVARVHHPTVAWWWGYRQKSDGFGAWCYLCDDRIVKWSQRWPMTQAAREAIIHHRNTIHAPGGN